MRRFLMLAAALVATATSAAPAAAQTGPAPVSRTGKYSPYELQSIRDVEADLGAPVDPSPEGKTIERIDIVTLEIIEKRDPAPQLLNAFHVTTRPYVIQREVLLREGDPYRQVLIDETARNLRGLPQLSLVLCVPLQGSRPDVVRVVVITKDVWSLRLSWDVALSSGGIERLVLQPGETNLFGTQQSLALRFNYLPASYTLGARYAVPRVLGSRIAAVADANVIMNNARGVPEGSYGSLGVAKPLFSSFTELAYGVNVSWRNEVTRRYVAGAVAPFDAKATPGPDGIPYQYRSDIATASVAVTRSFGWALKNNVTVGFEAARRAFRTDDLSTFNPVAVNEFVATRLPISETRVGPYVEVETYTSDFTRVLDFETLALQEDFRLGHNLAARVYPVNRALGSTRSFVGVWLGAQYTVPISDGLVRVSAEWQTETESDRLADASLAVGARLVTPRFGLGRLVFDATALSRYRNYLNGTSFLGGNGRLRGYPTNFFDGKDLVAYNLEYRSRPIEILSCHFGGALFYDAGAAFDGFDQRRMHHSAGAGVRMLFPQLDRTVFRVDVGVPIEPQGLPRGVNPVSFYVGFAQAFSVPTVAR